MNKILVISTVNDYPDEVELQGFFWLDDYGWCFSFGETEDDGGAYGVMTLDFVETKTNYESKILEFLNQISKNQNTNEDIPVSDFFKWAEIK